MQDAARLRDVVHPDHRADVEAAIARSAAELTVWRQEYRLLLPDGSEKWIFGNAVPEREADGSTLWHGFLTDITERKKAEAQIHALAYYDPLTGLPNRFLLQQRLRSALAESAASGRHGAVVFIDLDNFKILNDTKGHDAGDLLLAEVARRLVACADAGDIVARLGGDEFVIVLRELGATAEAAADAARLAGGRILAAIDRPCQLGSHVFHTTPSIGITLFKGNELSVDELLKRADVAMYEAKIGGRNTVRFFGAATQAALVRRLGLMNDLREAVETGGLHLHYQVQVDGDARPFAAEALLRWNRGDREPVGPDEFIPLAEETGLIGPIGRFVLDAAGRTIRAWDEQAETRRLQLAVNVSARQFREPDFVGQVEEALARSAADPARLVLELTEHVLLEGEEAVVERMHALKRLGVGLSLDDFGTGYSSLSCLKRLPVDQLKIARPFVRDLETDPNDRAVVRAIIAMAQSLGICVLAEGVETEAQRQFLERHGCRAFQGYLFARPLPRADFENLLGRPSLPAEAPPLRASA